MKDYYEVLGVRRGASEAEIALAYRGRRTQYHPDKYQDSDAETLRWATVKMQDVNEAYAVLSDAQRRARFDASNVGSVGEDEPIANRGDAAAAAPSPPALSAFLRQHAGAGGRFARTYFAPDIPLKKLSNALQSYGRDIQAEEVVALMDTTLFGGAKEGVMLTEKQIRLKDLGSGLAIWEWGNIRTIAAERTTIYVNGHKLIDCLAVNEGEVAYLVSGLQAFLQLRNKERPRSQEGQASDRREDGAAPLPQKYRNMYDMAKREFLELCGKIQKLEFQLGEDVIDRDNAAAYFGYLERCLRDGGKAEQAWTILGEIAILSKANVAFSETGKAFPPVIAQPQDDDSQLMLELRALLRFLQEAVQEAQRQAGQGFFRH